MNIKRDNLEETRFSKIHPGMVFTYCNTVYMKTSGAKSYRGDAINAIKLEDGVFTWFDENVIIYPERTAELLIP